MRITVEQREAGRERHAGGHRPLASGGDQEAQHQHRQGDGGLDLRQYDARPGQPAAHHHRADKGRGHGPQRPPALLCRPQADGDHGEQVVETQQRMR